MALEKPVKDRFSCKSKVAFSKTEVLKKPHLIHIVNIAVLHNLRIRETGVLKVLFKDKLTLRFPVDNKDLL